MEMHRNRVENKKGSPCSSYQVVLVIPDPVLANGKSDYRKRSAGYTSKQTISSICGKPLPTGIYRDYP